MAIKWFSQRPPASLSNIYNLDSRPTSVGFGQYYKFPILSNLAENSTLPFDGAFLFTSKLKRSYLVTRKFFTKTTSLFKIKNKNLQLLFICKKYFEIFQKKVNINIKGLKLKMF